MELTSYFDDFLAEIRPDEKEQKAYKKAHIDLRDLLEADDDISPLLVDTFLQGSYKRKTAIGTDEGGKSDVDVVAVTRISAETETPAKIKEVFTPFLDLHYKNQWKANDRSFEITLNNVKVDLVVTAAPSEADEEILKDFWTDLEEPPQDKVQNSQLLKSWFSDSQLMHLRKGGLTEALAKAQLAKWKTEPLQIPDRKMEKWDPTHPLAQIEWTWEKNAACNTHYINVVKAIKWWKKKNAKLTKYPKGYPVEHIIGCNCPDGIKSVPEGIVLTLENIVSNYRMHYAAGIKPILKDHGVPEHDVLERVSVSDFKNFYENVKEAAVTSRKAFDSDEKAETIKLWKSLFGDKFPGDDDDGGGSGSGRGSFTARTTETTSDIGKGRFA